MFSAGVIQITYAAPNLTILGMWAVELVLLPSGLPVCGGYVSFDAAGPKRPLHLRLVMRSCKSSPPPLFDG
jgi:hypothetical protein